MIIIDHEKYGITSEFETLEAAEQAMRDCGPEFADTKFRVMLDAPRPG